MKIKKKVKPRVITMVAQWGNGGTQAMYMYFQLMLKCDSTKKIKTKLSHKDWWTWTPQSWEPLG